MNRSIPDFSCFRNVSFLRRHILDTVAFYASRCIDRRNGGYINCFFEDGRVCDYEIKQLVGTARFIYVFSTAALIGGSAGYLALAEHGLRFLQDFHRDREHGGYYWVLRGRRVEDPTKQAYGHAFALLASAAAFKAGILWAESIIGDIYDVLEKRFWREEDGLYVDEISADWSRVSPYRGQNANMHLCEAMMAAYEATGEPRYLARAQQLARSVMFKLLPQSKDLIWEHFDEHWRIDWNYNKNNTKSEFRPYGYIFGHSIEWSKLLLLLDRHCPEEWLFPCAEGLFRAAANKGVDYRNGGIFFAMSPVSDSIIDSDKMYWVQAEAIGASALFASRTGLPEYEHFYNGIFSYCWNYFIDHRLGGWYYLLNMYNNRYRNPKSPPPKADYHPITNCMTALLAFGGPGVAKVLKM